MGNLWVATRDGGWVRADQIVRVEVERTKHSKWPQTFDVVLGTTMSAGSWWLPSEESGSGNLDPLELTLARCPDKDDAWTLARSALRHLITHADTSGVLEVTDDGEIAVQAIDEPRHNR